MNQERLNEKELFEEIRIAKTASLVALYVSLANILSILFFTYFVFRSFH